jgi:hypothetical protein
MLFSLMRLPTLPAKEGSSITNMDILYFQGDSLMRYLFEALILFCLIYGAIYANKTMAKECKKNKHISNEPGDAHT